MSSKRTTNASAATIGVAALLVLTAGAGLGGSAAARPATATESARAMHALDDDFEPANVAGDGALYQVVKTLGAHSAWSRSDATDNKVTGRGVAIALIDSGVDEVPGLDGGRVLHGPDLSSEASSDRAYDDGYGHGTHLAGILAGRDAAVTEGNENDSDHFVGVAPDATIVSIKVADREGGTSAESIIAAIDWAIEHRDSTTDPIRVITLAFGNEAVDPYEVDPLAIAVERAWHAGIVVVVAAGNDGNQTTSLANPAIDPFVLAVGAYDHRANEDSDDDTIADFTNRGSSTRSADLVAPGRSITSLAAENATIVDANPGSRNGRFIRGSGTSQATAFVAGAAALLLQERPELTPDQVKALLTTTADPIIGVDAELQGAGRLDIKDAIKTRTPDPTTATQTHPRAELEASFSAPADATSGTWDGRTWLHGTWEGRTWTGGQWTGRTWLDGAWEGRTWTGGTWTGRTWLGDAWSGRTWSGRTWTGRTWTGRTWTGRSWSGHAWGAG